jgi:GNAT superfamily N-acetyltransferase
MSIEELTTRDEMAEAYDVMHELRTDLNLDQYLELLERMQPDGYRLFALRDEGRIVALAGVGIGTNFYYRHYLWVYDLITTDRGRSKGHGKALMDHLEALARKEGCDTLALASGLQRKDAHRFYEERIGMTRASYTFSKDLR